MFDLGQPGGGLLALDPFPALGDPRLSEITVLDLLQHRGGWDRELASDWVFREIQIAEAMSVPSPPGRKNTVRYVLGQPLQFNPGSRRAYSNVGYLVLGLIVERVSGQDYVSYVRENIFAPLGVPAGDVIQGRTFPEDRSEREPWYDADGLARNVFNPTGSRVRWPDGGWDLEAKVGGKPVWSLRRGPCSGFSTGTRFGETISGVRVPARKAAGGGGTTRAASAVPTRWRTSAEAGSTMSFYSIAARQHRIGAST